MPNSESSLKASGTQILILVIGILMSAIASLTLAQISGLRGDIQTMVNRQDQEATARWELDKRVVALEHAAAPGKP